MAQKNRLIKRDPKYGHMVCRYKAVTEGEIVEAVRWEGRTLQDIKFMIRAGLGRCRGGSCGPHVIQILARELDISPTEVLGREAPALLVEYRDLPKAIHTN